MQVLLLGGSGRFGEYALPYLVRSEIVTEIGLAGRNETALKRRASEVGDKAHPVPIDIRDEGRLATLARDYNVVVNAAGPEWEVLLPALRASIRAGTHYCDLGADGQTAERQFELDSAAKEQDVAAIVGMGFDPGIDNLLAMHVRKQFDSVEEMRFCYHLALPDDLLKEAVDRLRSSGRVDASWQPVMSNIAEPIRVYRDRSWGVVDPFKHGVEITSPEGVSVTAYPAGFPEQITLPRYLPDVPTMSFLFAITPSETSQLVYREANRILHENVSIEDVTKSFLQTVGDNPGKYLKGNAPGWNMWLVVTGIKDDKPIRYTCWPERIGSTSVPLAVAALKILRGEVQVRGVLPPEACFEPTSFFEEVGRNMPTEDQKRPLYGERTEWL